MIKHSLRVKHLNLTLITKKYDKKHYLGTNNSLRKNMYDFTIRWLYKKWRGSGQNNVNWEGKGEGLSFVGCL